MPCISVVVPAYNIEAYLGDCLQSIADQTLKDFEVLVVNDGSTDGTREVATSFAAKDPRFRVLSQANGGLSHARNVGMAQVDGEFLSFVDGDDILPRRAFELLHATLARTGSDFATGNVHRFDSIGVRQLAMVEEIFSNDLDRTHVTRFPELLTDRTIWNKLYRRSFWDKHSFRFPTGMLHEDIPVTIPAHVLASSVDVVSQTCYLYRNRDGGADRSITQRRLDPRAIRDRTRAVDVVSRFLASEGHRRLKRRYDEACAAQDFRYTLQQLDEADGAFQQLYLDLVNDFFDRAHRGVFDRLPAIDRLKYHLVRQRLMPQLIEVLRFDKNGEANRTRDLRRRRRIYGDYPFRDDPQLRIPAQVFRIDPELRLRAQVDDVWWEGERLWVQGYAYIGRIELPTAESSRLKLTLRNKKQDRTIELPVERTRRPDVTASTKESVFDYEWCGFRTFLDVRDLRGDAGEWRPSVWRLSAEIWAGGQHRARRITVTAPGRAQRPEALTLDGVRVIPASATSKFGVLVDDLAAIVDTYRAQGEVVQLEGRVRRAEVSRPGTRLLLDRESESGQLSYPVSLSPAGADECSFVARVPLSELTAAAEVGDRASHTEAHGDGLVWALSLQQASPDKGLTPIAVGDDLADFRHVLDDREVLLERDRQCRLRLVERDIRPVVTAARWTGDDLELSGEFASPHTDDLDLVLSTVGRVEQQRFPISQTGSGFTVTVPSRVATLAGNLPLSEGERLLSVQRRNSDYPTSLKVSHDLVRQLPIDHSVGTKDYSLHYVDFDELGLDVSSDLLPDERGGFKQWKLQSDEFPAFVRREIRDTVLFEGYGGQRFADSPRAIAEELVRRGSDLELLWAVSDGQSVLPDGITPIRKHSREWYEANARSRYVVSCTYRPIGGWLRPPRDQVVVQTWHGAPFKKIGFDSERVERLSGRNYHDRLADETSRWNYLISPNPVASEILRSAFRYDGHLLETGYPRTDIFYRADREATAEQVRAQLDLPAGKKVVMYAPTFRDNLRYGRTRYRLSMQLDLEHAQRSLGDDYVLLMRSHSRIVDSLPGATAGFVRDVSRYPDVNELLLATDVLVTDYSSLLFDFANTGRPMLFFTYDLEQYRDELRGFYFDVDFLPGPILRTSPEVVEAIAEAERVQQDHQPAYETFQKSFCAFDDGHNTEQVVDEVFG